MKKSTLLLCSTLAANAALVGYLGYSRPTPDAPSARPRAQRERTDSSPATAAPAATASGVQGSAAPTASIEPGNLRLSPPQWDALLAGDLKALADHLRAAGVPDQAVSYVVNNAILQRNLHAYKRAYKIDGEIPPFWAPGDGLIGGTPSPEDRKAQLEIERVMTEQRLAALGSQFNELKSNPEFIASQRRTFGDVSLEKLQQLYDAQREISTMQSELYAKTAGGAQLPEDRARLQELETLRRAKFAAILSPEEMEGYDLRSSPSASTLRSQLMAFEPSEEEFKALMKVQKAFDDQFGSTMYMTPAQSQERAQRMPELRNQLAAALSPERANDYRLSTLPSATQVPRLVAKLNLPSSATLEILAVQKDIQDKAAAARSATRGNPSALAESLAQLNSEATTRLTPILGEKGLEGYRQYGGSWMQQLNPPAARGAPPPAAAGSGLILQDVVR